MPDEENKEVSVLPKNADLEELKQRIAELPEEDRVRILQQLGQESAVTTATFHSGPLPEPAAFKAYDDTCPGAADRILSMAENEQAIRREGQQLAAQADRMRIRTGGWLGFGLLAIAAAALFSGGSGTYVSIPFGLAGTLVTLVRMWMKYQQWKREQAQADRNSS